jgi:hypothetical protein
MGEASGEVSADGMSDAAAENTSVAGAEIEGDAGAENTSVAGAEIEGDAGAENTRGGTDSTRDWWA